MANDALLINLLTRYLNDLGSSYKNKNLSSPRTQTSASSPSQGSSSNAVGSAIAQIKSALAPLEEDIFTEALSDIEETTNDGLQLVKDFNRDKHQRQASNMRNNGQQERLKSSLLSINDGQGQKLSLFLTA
jgi:hypothetical protein